MIQQRTADSKLLRCPQVKENTRTSAIFSIFPRRTRKQRTGWRMTQSDANCSPSICQPVDTQAAVDRGVVDTMAAVTGRGERSVLFKHCYRYLVPPTSSRSD